MILLIATGILANPPQRVGKNLSGVFPFNTNNGHGAHHGDHGHHGNHQAHQPFNPRDSRQGSGAGGDASTDLASIRAELYRPPRERCIDKVVMVEETEYDDVETCKHSYSEKCYTTYVTDFEPAQEEECEETFTKRCFIEYKKVASDETVTFCHTPTLLVGDGADVCTTVTESYCKTHYHEHNVLDDVVKCETILEEKCEDVTQGYTTSTKCTKWPRQVCTKTPTDVKKYTPQTDCEPIPRKVCGRGNRQVPGKEECFDKKETVIQEVYFSITISSNNMILWCINKPFPCTILHNNLSFTGSRRNM